ncbi:type 1 glutamine amidotransferase [Spirillospora sp. NPDC029432]|uniref:type 1 glutamine amidotransferase n=1 Tax=Spirillospora sp. NPDC029432 TaxID=3154599 RepID=UPI0034552B82
MRALVIEQDPMCPAGTVGDRLVQHGFDLVTLTVVPAGRRDRPGVDRAFPTTAGWDVIVALGAPWSVDDEAAIGPWIGAELAFLRAAHEAGTPVLGICFGGQALATALGGGVERAPRVELGWTEVETAEPALIAPGPWFEFHTDRWSLPPGAVEIARTDVGSQAFRIGRSLAVQFHPEVTLPVMKEWLEHGAEQGIETGGLLDRSRGMMADAERRAHALVDAFLEHAALDRAPLGAD